MDRKRTTRRRFYKDARTASSEGGYGVALDGRLVRTPMGAPLSVANLRLAEAVAGEWEAQGEEILPHTMPITQLVTTAIDRVGGERDNVVSELAGYAETDLLCYRAGGPQELVDRESVNWDPLLTWLANTHGAKLTVTSGVVPVPQPKAAVAALRRAVEAKSDLELAALSSAASACSSLVLAMALADGCINAELAYELSQLEESWQTEQWGDDEGAAEQRVLIKADIVAAGVLLALV